MPLSFKRWIRSFHRPCDRRRRSFSGSPLLTGGIYARVGGASDVLEDRTLLAAPILDVDGNGQVQALSDGVLLMRHLAGFTGDELIKGAIDVAATRTNAQSITDFLNHAGSAFDIDGDQTTEPLSDGLLAIRFGAGFTGDVLINGAVNTSGQRTTAAAVTDYLAERVPGANDAPQLVPVPDQSVGEGRTLSLRPTATDPDDPASDLRYDFAATPPTGATINPFSGRITWQPPAFDNRGDFGFSVKVTDAAGDSDSVAFTVNVDNAGAIVADLSPAAGEEMVSVVRKAIATFSEAVDPATVTNNAFQLTAAGVPVQGSIRVSSTEQFATFIPAVPLPASTEVHVIVNGDLIVGRDGLNLDADGDGQPGGISETVFRTLPLNRVPGTTVFGFVRDSYTGDFLVGATIRVDAFPEANAVTDQNGRFELANMPAPEFFVHVDGSTATHRNVGGTQVPIDAEKATYPNVGKPFHSSPGQTVQLNHHGEVFDVFLPPIAVSDIQPLSGTTTTTIGFGSSGKAELATMFPSVSASMFDRMTVDFAANSAINNAGTPATTATIIPVPPDRLPAPLPPDVDTPLVVSIQALGANQFDVPAPVSFPNLDGVEGGTQALIMSFNHDAGRWEPVAPATVSDDGQSVDSLPGTGVRAPGWHYVCFCVQVEGTIVRPKFDASGTLSLVETPIDDPAAVAEEDIVPVDDRIYIALLNQDSGRIVRLQSEPGGTFQILLPRDTPFQLTAYDPFSNLSARRTFRSPDRIIFGNRSDLVIPIHDLGQVLVGTADEEDTDGEGLTNVAEFVVGTFVDQPDSDADGTNDFDEVRLGRDPTGGEVLPFGVTAALQLINTATHNLGIAGGVVVTEHPRNPLRKIAWTTVVPGNFEAFDQVTIDPAELLAIDVTDRSNPVVLSRTVLSETATGSFGPGAAIAIDQTTSRLVVGGGGAGLVSIEISNPLAPALTAVADVDSHIISVSNGLAYVVSPVTEELAALASPGTIGVVDLETGKLLQEFQLAGRKIDDLVVANNAVYVGSQVFDGVRLEPHLDRLSLSNDGLITDIRATYHWDTELNFPIPPTAVAVNGDLVYLSLAVVNATAGGFVVLQDQETSFSVVGTPAPVSTTMTDMLVDGTGNLLFTDQFVIQVMDVTDPATTDALIAAPAVPVGFASGLAVEGGTAYILGDGGGSLPTLYLFNYFSGSVDDESPAVFITPSVEDALPATDGLQLLEGRTLSVNVNVTDASPVKSVRLIVDDEVVATDAVYPWHLAVETNQDWVDRGITDVRVEAVDANGNVGLSNVMRVAVLDDSTPPDVASVVPTAGTNAGRLPTEATLTFTEPIDLDTVGNQTIQLRTVGAGTIISTQLSGSREILRLSFDPLADGEYEIVLQADQLRDLAGNTLAAGTLGQTQFVSRFNVAQRTATWISSTGGSWHEPANWDIGFVPGPHDDVVVDVVNATANDTILIDGVTGFRSLTANIPVEIRDSRLAIADTLTANAGLTIVDSQLTGGGISAGSGPAIELLGGFNLFRGVRWMSDVNVATGLIAIHVGDLELGGDLNIASNATFRIEGVDVNEVAITGSGTIRFPVTGDAGTLEFFGRDSDFTDDILFDTVRIGSGVHIAGGEGTVVARDSRGRLSLSLINEASVHAMSADPPGTGGIFMNDFRNITNSGDLQVDEGGQLGFGGHLINSGDTVVRGRFFAASLIHRGGTLELHSSAVIQTSNSAPALSGLFILETTARMIVHIDGATSPMMGELFIGGGDVLDDNLQLHGDIEFRVHNGDAFAGEVGIGLNSWAGTTRGTISVTSTFTGLTADAFVILELVVEEFGLGVIVRLN